MPRDDVRQAARADGNCAVLLGAAGAAGGGRPSARPEAAFAGSATLGGTIRLNFLDGPHSGRFNLVGFGDGGVSSDLGSIGDFIGTPPDDCPAAPWHGRR